MNDMGLEEWKTRLPNEIVIDKCVHCDEEIYRYEEHYRTIEGRIHEECFSWFAEKYLQAELDDGTEDGI